MGLPNFTIVGLTDRAIQEAPERVRASICNAGFEFPTRRPTVNLAPCAAHARPSFVAAAWWPFDGIRRAHGIAERAGANDAVAADAADCVRRGHQRTLLHRCKRRQRASGIRCHDDQREEDDRRIRT